MKKIFTIVSMISLLISGFAFALVAEASTLLQTPTIPAGYLNQSYSAHITFFSDVQYGTVDVSMSNLPTGITLANANSSSPPPAIFGLTQKDANGNYYFDLTGAPTQTGTFSPQLHIFDPIHGDDLIYNYSLQVLQPVASSFVTTSLQDGTVGQHYSSRILVTSNGSASGPNMTISNLPSGISLINADIGHPEGIYGDGAKDANGYYYLDLSGTALVSGTTVVHAEIFDTYHTYDVTRDFSITIKANAVDPNAHSNGTNVLATDGTVYFITGNTRRPYTSAGAFLSYGFNNWASVQFANSADLALPVGSKVPPRDGALINDNGTVYLISDGLRYGFSSAAAFLGLGFSFANVTRGDTSFMAASPLTIGTEYTAHIAGTLVNDNGTIYLIMKNGTRLGFPNMAVFNSWGFKLKEVVMITTTDRIGDPVSGVIYARTAEQLNP